eukprot:gnl/MRDRNA2_/MRDRNA2_94652_c0_seq1.p1 gnl/MRDRNA2_/MRDRNA2_94652_c0~~gnl/MRDRNA2_/MRDRNA2_94652_c0_seq1.p1  ORF type:complete len:258 (+),score=65.06 gnl/MRDRNA2_/MRDRNA2_94652_c0_seq1:71-844(+)
MDEIDEEPQEVAAPVQESQPEKSMAEAAKRHRKSVAKKQKDKRQSKQATDAARLLKEGTKSSGSADQESNAQFDGQFAWDGSSDALDELINSSDPTARMEAVKIRLASTMDRYAFFNNTRMGFSTLTASQNRKLEFDIRCRTGSSLQSRILRGVPEAKRLLNGQKVQHMEKGTVHQRLRMIDTFCHKENVRSNPESPPRVRKLPQMRQSLSTELPSYADIIEGKVGSSSGDPILATTCGVPPQKLGLSKSSPALPFN